MGRASQSIWRAADRVVAAGACVRRVPVVRVCVCVVCSVHAHGALCAIAPMWAKNRSVRIVAGGLCWEQGPAAA